MRRPRRSSTKWSGSFVSGEQTHGKCVTRSGTSPPTSPSSEADLLVEVSGSHGAQHEVAGVGVGDAHVSTTLGVVISRVAAEVRLYDARTHELVDHYELSKSKTAVVPTSLGLGDGRFFVYSVVPIARHFQYRSAIRDVATEAAERITARQ